MSEFACFLSYSDHDRAAADRVRGALIARGLPVFVDRHSIDAGENWRRKIKAGIESSEALLILVSENSITSKAVIEEVDIALSAEVPLIPVIMHKSATDAPSPLLDRIAERQWIRMPQAVTSATSNIDLSAVVRAVRRKWHPTAPVIAVSNLKGGVGKTTLAAHVFSALSNHTTLSILMIDLDPQANLSQFVLPQRRLHSLIEDDKSVLSLFENSLVYGAASPRASLFSTNDSIIDKVAINDIAEEVGSSELALLAGVDPKPVYLIAGQFELVKYTLPMNAPRLQSAKANFLKSINAARKEFDVIVIDLNPSSSFMIECALTAATHVLCPMRPDKYSIQGLQGMKRLIEGAYGLPIKPQIIGVFNGVPAWNSLVQSVKDHADDATALGALRIDDKISDCIEAILEVVNSRDLVSSLILTEVPETPMLRAYFEDSSAGFFGLSSFNRKGRYGAELRNRLRTIAQEIATLTRAEALDVPHQR